MLEFVPERLAIQGEYVAEDVEEQLEDLGEGKAGDIDEAGEDAELQPEAVDVEAAEGGAEGDERGGVETQGGLDVEVEVETALEEIVEETEETVGEVADKGEEQLEGDFGVESAGQPSSGEGQKGYTVKMPSAAQLEVLIVDVCCWSLCLVKHSTNIAAGTLKFI